MQGLISRNNTSDLRFLSTGAQINPGTFRGDHFSGIPSPKEKSESPNLFQKSQRSDMSPTEETHDVEAEIKAAAKAEAEKLQAQLEKLKKEAVAALKKKNIISILFNTTKLDKGFENELKVQIQSAQTVEVAKAVKDKAEKILHVDANATADEVDKNNKQNAAAELVMKSIEPPFDSPADHGTQIKTLADLSAKVLDNKDVDTDEVKQLMSSVAGQGLREALQDAASKNEGKDAKEATEQVLHRIVIASNDMTQEEAREYLMKEGKKDNEANAILIEHFGQEEIESEFTAHPIASPTELETNVPHSEAHRLLGKNEHLLPEGLQKATEEIIEAIADYATAELPEDMPTEDRLRLERIKLEQQRRQTIYNLATDELSVDQITGFQEIADGGLGPTTERAKAEEDALQEMVIEQNKRQLADLEELVNLLPEQERISFTDKIAEQNFHKSVRAQLQEALLGHDISPEDQEKATLAIRDKLLERVMRMTGCDASKIEEILKLSIDEISIEMTNLGFVLVFKGEKSDLNLKTVENPEIEGLKINAVSWIPREGAPIMGVKEQTLQSGLNEEIEHHFQNILRAAQVSALEKRTAKKIASRFIHILDESRIHPREVYSKIGELIVRHKAGDLSEEEFVQAIETFSRENEALSLKNDREKANDKNYLSRLLKTSYEIEEDIIAKIHTEELASNMKANLVLKPALTTYDAGIIRFDRENRYHIGAMMLVNYVNKLKSAANTDEGQMNLAALAQTLSREIIATERLNPKNVIDLIFRLNKRFTTSNLPALTKDNFPPLLEGSTGHFSEADIKNEDLRELANRLYNAALETPIEEITARPRREHKDGWSLYSAQGIASYHAKISNVRSEKLTKLTSTWSNPIPHFVYSHPHLAEKKRLAWLLGLKVDTGARIFPSTWPNAQKLMRLLGVSTFDEDSIGPDNWLPGGLGKTKFFKDIFETRLGMKEDPIVESVKPFLSAKYDVKNIFFLRNLQTHWQKQGLPIGDLHLMLEMIGAPYQPGAGIDTFSIRPLSEENDQYRDNAALKAYLIDLYNKKRIPIPPEINDLDKPETQKGAAVTGVKIGTMTDSLAEEIQNVVSVKDFEIGSLKTGVEIAAKFKEIAEEMMTLEQGGSRCNIRDIIQKIRDVENAGATFIDEKTGEINPNWKDKKEIITVGSKKFKIEELRWFVMHFNLAKLMKISKIGVHQRFDPSSLNNSGLELAEITTATLTGPQTRVAIVDSSFGFKIIKEFEPTEWATISARLTLTPGTGYTSPSTGQVVIPQKLKAGESFYYDGFLTRYHEASGRSVYLKPVNAIEDEMITKLFGKDYKSPGTFENGLIPADAKDDIDNKQFSLKYYNVEMRRHAAAREFWERSDRTEKIWNILRRVDDLYRYINVALAIAAFAIPGLGPILAGSLLFNPTYIIAFLVWNWFGSTYIDKQAKLWGARTFNSIQLVNQLAGTVAKYKEMADDTTPAISTWQQDSIITQTIFDKQAYKALWKPKDFEHKYSNSVTTALGGLGHMLGLSK